MKKAGKIVIGLVCVGAFGALMFTRFTKKEEPIEAVPNPTVVVQTPETGNIELSTGLTGTVEPADQVYIIPKGSGEVHLIGRFHGTGQSCGKFNISCLRCLDDDGRVRNGLNRLFFFRKSCEHQGSKCTDAYKPDYDLTCFFHGSSSFSATCCFLISPAEPFLSSNPHVLFRGQLFYSLPLLLFPAV